jgi:hypothetical protein
VAHLASRVLTVAPERRQRESSATAVSTSAGAKSCAESSRSVARAIAGVWTPRNGKHTPLPMNRSCLQALCSSTRASPRNWCAFQAATKPATTTVRRSSPPNRTPGILAPKVVRLAVLSAEAASGASNAGKAVADMGASVDAGQHANVGAWIRRKTTPAARRRLVWEESEPNGAQSIEIARDSRSLRTSA